MSTSMATSAPVRWLLVVVEVLVAVERVEEKVIHQRTGVRLRCPRGCCVLNEPLIRLSVGK